MNSFEGGKINTYNSVTQQCSYWPFSLGYLTTCFCMIFSYFIIDLDEQGDNALGPKSKYIAKRAEGKIWLLSFEPKALLLQNYCRQIPCPRVGYVILYERVKICLENDFRWSWTRYKEIACYIRPFKDVKEYLEWNWRRTRALLFVKTMFRKTVHNLTENVFLATLR